MANTMDTILVKYGAAEIDSAHDQSEHPEVKTVPLPEFLKLKPEELNESEQKIQRAIRLIYDLNGKDPPLYEKFPNFRSDKFPLTIDTTTAVHKKDVRGEYNHFNNTIVFSETDYPDDLVTTMAHELKHAEQYDKELLNLQGTLETKNPYALHQLKFLIEGQAFAFGNRVYYEIFGRSDTEGAKLYERLSQKYADSAGHKDEKKIEEIMIKSFINDIDYDTYGGRWYKDDFDKYIPLGDDIDGLDHIPDGLHLSQELLSVIEYIPFDPYSAQARMDQAVRMEWIDRYMESLSCAIENDEEVTADMRFILEKGSLEQLQMALMLQKKNGDYLFKDDVVNGDFLFHKLDGTMMEYLLNVERDRKRIITLPTIADKLVRLLNDEEKFSQLCALVQDEKGALPFTEKDFTQSWGNELLIELFVHTHEYVENAIHMLPKILKLKGKDGKPLVNEEQVAKKLCHCASQGLDPQSLKKVFQCIMDEQGNLPFSREVLDVRNDKEIEGQNWLLFLIHPRDEKEKNNYSQVVLPFFMSLKDKMGRPIISQENIECFPDDDLLTKDVKAYLRTRKGHHDEAKKGISGRLSQTEDKKTAKNPAELTGMVLKRKLPQAGD